MSVIEGTFHVLNFVAENYKKIRIVDITPTGRMINITGRNGQGKTSVLDALWAGLDGKRAIPDKPVRKGANKSKITFALGDAKTGKRTIIGKRTINDDRTTSIELTNADGTKYGSPQALLDDLVGELGMDPLEFLKLDTKQQVIALRRAAKVDYDFDAAEKANAEDFAERTNANREIKRLEAEIASITVQDNLPKEKQDEVPILAELTGLSQANLEARRLDTFKARAEDNYNNCKWETAKAATALQNSYNRILDLEQELLAERTVFALAEEARNAALKAEHISKEIWDDAPAGDFKDAAAITERLQNVQTANREIDKRTRRDTLKMERDVKQKQADEMTRRISRRDEAKAAAVSNAKLPVDGLQFDENQVLLNGIPIDQLGEAEQIRVSALVAMAANPKLRVLRIMHGEALDPENLALLAQLAEEREYQIWVASVDATGKVGIVMEDGEVKTVNEAAE